jgi:hypothetical protein
MKRTLLLFVLLFAVESTFSQCNTFYNFKEGAEYEMTHFDKKGKKTGRSLTRIISLEQKDGELIATVEGIAFDKKDKEINRMQYEYHCENGTLKLDLSTFIPREQFEKNPDIKFEMSGDFLEIPAELEAGQKLPDGSITGKMIMSESGPMASMDMTVTVKNRRVETKEDITTTLGTFPCYKLTYDLNTTTKMMGMNVNYEGAGIDYLTEGIGVIRTEAYNKKGKMAGYSILTNYK